MAILQQRLVVLTSFTPYTLLHMGGALAQNTQTVLVTRLLAGILGSARQSMFYLTTSAALVMDLHSF